MSHVEPRTHDPADQVLTYRRRLSRVLIGMTRAARHAYWDWVTFYVLSRQIRHMRRSRGWTQAQLAERAGLQVQTIWRVEKWQGCRRATVQTLGAIAAAFDVALQIGFVSFGEWVEYYITPDGIRVVEDQPVPASFHQELGGQSE